jgi:hypothetical protein
VAVAETNSPAFRGAGLAMALHVALAAALRLFCIFRYCIDSDEPQHLHVAWEWSRRAFAYRDFYDNHFPLFHLLFAPLVAIAPRSSSVLLLGRLAMLPIAAAALWVTWRIAERLYDREAATWATLVTALFPVFLLRGVEFRSDNLWALLALGAVAALLAGRHFTAGVILGFALLTSIKTVHFAIAIAAALLYVHRRRAFALMARIAAGGALPVAAATIWIAANHALAPMWLWAVDVNRRVPVSLFRRVRGAVIVVCVIAAAFVIVRRARSEARALLTLIGLFAAASVMAISPLISPRDFLPVLPMTAIVLAAHVIPRLGGFKHAVPAVLALATIQFGRLTMPPPRAPFEMIDEAMRLTAPNEFVLDAKGQTVFRPRPTFMTFEKVSRRLIVIGEVRDTVVEDLIRNRCYVATEDADHFPPRTRAFLNAHYLKVGTLRVAGARAGDDGAFEIAIPGSYVVRSPDLPPRWYDAGVHRLTPGAVVLWAGVQRLGK